MKKLYLTRRMKARQIADSGNIRQVGISFSFKVRSQKNPNVEYSVFHNGKSETAFCECKDFELTQQPCKHIMAVELVKYGMIKVIAK